MSNKAFLVILAVAGVLLAAIAYLHLPHSGSTAASLPAALHGR
jgi:hypothetical protein